MSLTLYWNDYKIDLPAGTRAARTLQTNDLARLSDRQSNYSQSIFAPWTPNNRIVFKHLGLAGSTSRIPYQENTVMLFDDSGECLIYKGWGKVTNVTDKGVNFTVYDGVVDFYKAIENKNLTQIGISDLNHIKNLATIVESFGDSKPYKYIIADYNGKTFFDDGVNIDYLVPSARISYIWNQIHLYAGFTFEGSTFLTEKFLNFYMSYPKPVPILEPIIVPQTEQNAQIIEYPSYWPTDFGGFFYGANYIATILPNTFDTAQSNNNARYIVVEETGAYRIKCTGSFTNNFGTDGIVKWSLRDSLNTVIQEGEIDGVISGSAVISATEGNRIYLIANRTGSNAPGIYNPLTGSMLTNIDLIVGYDANFEEVLVEFSARDFVNEIMVHFGITGYKDKYTDHIVYKTLDEVLQNPIIQNWSSKYAGGIGEKYELGTYAQRNVFKYKYNDENDTHKDGFIEIDDVNLKDESISITSKIYAPEKKLVTFLGLGSHVYPIWNKEVKDNGDINYKDLSGRFYFLRSQSLNRSLFLTSENLNTSQNVAAFPFESDYRLSYQQIIYDNYLSIGSILDQAKVREDYFWLTNIDIQNFKFQELIYVEQLGSYYMVNKISNFRQGVKTKCELIEVDYFKELDIPDPESTLVIDSATVLDCTVTITVTTNISQPTQVQVIPYTMAAGQVGDFYWQPYLLANPIYATMNGNEISFICDFLPYSIYGYRFLVKHIDNVFNEVSSQMSEVVNVSADCYDAPFEPSTCDPTSVQITNIYRSNAAYPTNYDQGSLWGIQYELEGVAPDDICTPYKIRVEINSNQGLQVYNSGEIFSVVGSVAFNLSGRPYSAAIRIYFINPDLVEFASPIYNYPS